MTGYQSYVLNERYGGPEDTKGRTGLACQECNPLYGLCDTAFDDIYDDAQPLRASKEAAKSFVRRMRARFDQVAFVEYSTTSAISRELNCLRQRDLPVELGAGYYDAQTGDAAWVYCFDHRTADGQVDTSRQSGSIVNAIETMELDFYTDIAGGLQRGIQVLSTGAGHYGRPYARQYIVLMTDGVANRWPGYPNQQDCNRDEREDASDEVKAQACAEHYAAQANDLGIRVFVIGLGLKVDQSWLQDEIATEPQDFILAETAEQLSEAFDEIASRLDLRLVE
jgi:hypothetical protein